MRTLAKAMPQVAYGEILSQGQIALRAQAAQFDLLLERTAHDAKHGRDLSAAVWVQAASHYAMSRHAGRFSSSCLEALLLDIGRRLARGDGRSARPASRIAPGHVLHVLTEAYVTGGHTRMVWRWIESDPERRHSVVMTRQGALMVPPQLQAAVRRAGGQVTVLNQRRGNLLAWASDLRRLGMSCTMIVLHQHPFDAVPTLAFADKARCPPILYLNHSDHTFWLGAAISDLIVNQRRSGADLAVRRRGVSADRLGLLPIVLPATPAAGGLPRRAAREELGLAADAVVLLSIARPHKYHPLGNVDFLAAVVPVLKAHPQAVLLVAGPVSSPFWQEAARQTGGRVRALGRVDDTAHLYAAADIYLDSLPVTSITSILEAASCGMPALSLFPYQPGSQVLCADTPALTDGLLSVTTLEAYQEHLAQLIVDHQARATWGDRLRTSVAQVHTGAGWNGYLAHLYSQVEACSPQLYMPADDQAEWEELDYLIPMIYATEIVRDDLEQMYLRLFPFARRVSSWVSLRHQNQAPSPGLLLPEWLGVRYELWRHPQGHRQAPWSQ